MKIDSLFDEDAGGIFKDIIKDFKPFVPEDIPTVEGEESEEEADEKELDEDDFEKYFEDAKEEVPDFGKTWGGNDRYNTIETEDEDWDDQRGEGIPPIDNQEDEGDEIEGAEKSVALEII